MQRTRTLATCLGVLLSGFLACRGDKGTTAVTEPGIEGGSYSSDFGGARSNIDFDEGGKPHSSNVEALVIISHNRGRFRTCEGTDGFYAENLQINTGTVTGDPRLAGAIEMHVTELVHFGDDVRSPSFGTFVIRDAVSGKTKVEGDYDAWAHEDLVHGTLVGRVVRSPAGKVGGNLIANIRLNFGENGSLTIQIGGTSTPESRLNAGIWGGQCSGKFTAYDNDVPPPAAALTSRIPTSGAAPQLWRNFKP